MANIAHWFNKTFGAQEKQVDNIKFQCWQHKSQLKVKQHFRRLKNVFTPMPLSCYGSPNARNSNGREKTYAGRVEENTKQLHCYDTNCTRQYWSLQRERLVSANTNFSVSTTKAPPHELSRSPSRVGYHLCWSAHGLPLTYPADAEGKWLAISHKVILIASDNCYLAIGVGRSVCTVSASFITLIRFRAFSTTRQTVLFSPSFNHWFLTKIRAFALWGFPKAMTDYKHKDKGSEM